MKKALVQYSGGVGSFYAARRAIERYGVENTILVFADVKMEDEDLYRFINESVSKLGAKLEIISDGRTPWDVFFDERFLGNSRIDPCSRILKRSLLDKWMTERFKPEDVVLVFGIDWTEEHRIKNVKSRLSEWEVWAPMCEPPFLRKDEMVEGLKAEGIEPPRLYQMGFSHNNCGGFCIKAGQAHFKLLLEKMPERYAYHENKEQEIREFLGKDVTILRVTRAGIKHKVTLKTFREWIQSGKTDEIDVHEWGGCGCAL
jgi:hypothetical protein